MIPYLFEVGLPQTLFVARVTSQNLRHVAARSPAQGTCLGGHCHLGRVNAGVAHSPSTIHYGAGNTN